MAKGKKSSAEKKAAGARRRERERERNRERNALRRAHAGPQDGTQDARTSASGDPRDFWRALANAEPLTPELVDELVDRGGSWTRERLEEAAAEGMLYLRSRNTLAYPPEFEGPMFGR